MVKLESFSSLSKPQDDLFKKGFSYVNHFGVHYKDTSDSGFTYRVSAKQPQGQAFSTGFWAEKKFSNGFTFREDFDAEQTYKAALDFVPPSEPGLKLHGEFTAKAAVDPEISPSVSAEYTCPNAKVKLALTRDPIIKLTSVAGVENVGLGFELAYDWSKKKLTTYNASLYYTELSYRLVLKHLSNKKAAEFQLGNISLSGFAKVDNSLSVGAEVEYDKTKENPVAQLAVQKVFDEYHTGKLRIKDSGEVATSITHKLNSHIALTTSSSLAFTSLGAWPKFQMGFKLRATN